MGSGRGHARWVVPLLVGLLCAVVYNLNLRVIEAGDTLPARYQPLILWHDGTLSLEGNERLVAHGYPVDRAPEPGNDRVLPDAYWMVTTKHGETASLYPVVVPLIVAPLYLPAVLYLEHHGWQQPKLDRAAEVMEKLAASLLAALAAVVMFLVLRRERNAWTIPLTAAFAFGTTSWVISSQALWQHGAGELLVAVGLLLAVSRRSPVQLMALGFVGSLMAANRPPDALIAAAVALAVLWGHWRSAPWLAAGAVPPALAVLAYNLGFVGTLMGGYALCTCSTAPFFGVSLTGPLGMLVSPTRGLLVFSPFFVFLLIGLRQRLRNPDTRILAIALSAAAVAQLLFYSQADWRAGASWGPRWLTDLLPILIWLLAPAPALLRPVARRAFVATVVVAMVVEAIGAFWYTGVSDERIFAGHSSSMKAAWNPANTPFVVELGHRPAAADLLCGAAGQIDVVGLRATPPTGIVPALRSGTVVQGWALACRRTPAEVLLLIDGQIVGMSTLFGPRSDVTAATGSRARAGWQTVVDTHGIEPGEHVLQLAVRHAPSSDIRMVQERTVRVSASPPLTALAARAARRIRADQADAGYWVTTHTPSPVFADRQIEMNTYVTSVMIDLLAPVATGLKLGPAVERGRGHLRQQVEGTGLVRYHGLPDGPGIGTLGCVITPDSDDTALAWRVAGLDHADPRARPMLDVLARYRDEHGLYRTWLARQRDYKCINPGSDPNPADLGIQMHVYLMLRQFDPPAARRLCSAIRRSYGDDRAWVYYAKAPIVPYLRTAELTARGCPLPLQSSIVAARQVEGQELWGDVAVRLVSSTGSRASAADRKAIRVLLERLSVDNFAPIRQKPPLLYHNDLSASVRRFYWSEDVGYALWLRLYEASR